MMNDNNERFYSKDNWYVTDNKNFNKVFIKTPIMDIIDKLPRNTGSTYIFKRVEKADHRTEELIIDEGEVNLEIKGMIPNDEIQIYFDRRYGNVEFDGEKVSINVSTDGLADKAKSKLTDEEYEMLVNDILKTKKD